MAPRRPGPRSAVGTGDVLELHDVGLGCAQDLHVAPPEDQAGHDGQGAAPALAASVLRRAVPMDPPTCWLVFSEAEPTPASWGARPRVPVLNAGARLNPNPKPSRMM